MTEPRRMKVKVCLVGEHAVGKTSLIRRYVLDEFDDRYIVTLGAKVSKKEMLLESKANSGVQMDMTIWDIMGSKGFRELLREAYFHGAQGILAVCDILGRVRLPHGRRDPRRLRSEQGGPQGSGRLQPGTGEAGDGGLRCPVLPVFREDG